MLPLGTSLSHWSQTRRGQAAAPTPANWRLGDCEGVPCCAATAQSYGQMVAVRATMAAAFSPEPHLPRATGSHAQGLALKKEPPAGAFQAGLVQSFVPFIWTVIEHLLCALLCSRFQRCRGTGVLCPTLGEPWTPALCWPAGPQSHHAVVGGSIVSLGPMSRGDTGQRPRPGAGPALPPPGLDL